MVIQELQAIVMAAGHGTRLPEVLDGTPKCLLPVGPFPLLWYPLNLLQQHNFQDAIVIVLENEKTDIQLALERTPLKLKLDLISIPSDGDFGTADSLRYINDKIKTDILVLSCDLVSNVSLYTMINKFREHDAALVTLFFNNGFNSDIPLPGPKTKYKPERDLIGIHPDTKRLLFMASASDFDEFVTISKKFMQKNGKMIVHSLYLDSHIYIMKKWVVEFLKKKENLSTLKGEFLPYIVKKQMSKPSTNQASPIIPVSDTQSERGVGQKGDDNIFKLIPKTNLDQQILEMTLHNDNLRKPLYMGDQIRCYAVEAPKDRIGIRVNTLVSFFSVNQKICNIWSTLCDGQDYGLISNQAVNKSTQIKSIAAAENAQLSEKTSLTSSVFAANCFIHSKTVVNRSLLMSNVTVEEGCNIDNCIIAPRSLIKKGSKLKNCIIGANYIVDENSIYDSKHLTHSDDFMEIDIQ